MCLRKPRKEKFGLYSLPPLTWALRLVGHGTAYHNKKRKIVKIKNNKKQNVKRIQCKKRKVKQYRYTQRKVKRK
jgi:hypothetical protein